MDAQTDPKRELAFLREQMHASDQKIARLQNALDNCEDRLESSSLTAMLHAANLERDLLNTVIMRQVDSNSVSLQAVILDQQETIRQAADPQTLRWQRGQATPTAYWDAEIRQAYLDDLLRRSPVPADPKLMRDVIEGRLSPGERYDQWRRIRTGDLRLVVGSRSAVFAPMRDLGLIVLDEEHEPSYKQQQTPNYHARDVAVRLARLTGATCILGSATPALESAYRAERGEYYHGLSVVTFTF